MDLLQRFKIAFDNEQAAGILEASVLILVFTVISYYLLGWLSQFLEFGKTRTGYTTTTGWFRTQEVNGIKNSD